jgi:ankyrin repeat protein
VGGDRALFKLIRSDPEEGHVEACVKLLIHLGANAMHDDFSKAFCHQNALELAALMGKTVAVRALVASNKFPPPLLDRAVKRVARSGGGQEWNGDAVRILVDGGADPNAVDEYSMTPIMWAAQSGNSSVFAALVERGANLEAVCSVELRRGWTVTMWAVYGGNPSVVTALAAQGADLNKADIGGMTPTILAVKLDHHDAFEALVHGGADINLADKEGKTPLMWASEPSLYSQGMKARISVGMLVSAGAEVDSVDNDGKSALMWAAMEGASDAVVAALIRHGANLHLASHNGDTATALAIGSGDLAIWSALRKA